jgi:hypothetical protein
MNMKKKHEKRYEKNMKKGPLEKQRPLKGG